MKYFTFLPLWGILLVCWVALEQYKQLFPQLKKLSLMHKGKQYDDLKKKVNERLNGMNFELKKRFWK